MKHIGFLLGLLMLFTSCERKKHVKVALFFNPSYAFGVKTQSFSMKLDGFEVIDTMISSTTVDKSMLLKCFDIQRSVDQTVKLKINNKDTSFVVNESSDCLSIFTSYDDHTKASETLYKLTEEKEMSGDKFNEQILLDKLTNNDVGDIFDSLEVTIKRDTCWCNN